MEGHGTIAAATANDRDSNLIYKHKNSSLLKHSNKQVES
jgi:hypothetical protein